MSVCIVVGTSTRQEDTIMDRRTSLYTLRLADEQTAAAVNTYGMVIQDRGPGTIGFRANNDDHARAEVNDMMAGLDDPYVLTTGLGIHRRTVTERA